MIRRRFLQSIVVCAGTGPWLAGCTRPIEPLRFGANLWPGYAPLRLAAANGLIGPDRLRVLDFPSASMVLSAFRNGSIDAAGLTLDEALVLAANDQSPRIILVFDFSDGADVILAQPGITSIAELKGRRIGVETEALGAYMIGRALARVGLPLSEVELVSVPFDRHEASFTSRQIDALVTFDPVRTRLLAAGANEVFSSRSIPGEIVDVLVVRDSLLHSRRADLAALVAAHFTAREAMLADPSAAAARLGARLGLDANEFIAALERIRVPGLDENRRLLGAGAQGLMPVLMEMSAVMRALGLIDETPSLSDMLVPDLIGGG
ncbi:MAG: ABC transporter substrate-binding protein [Azoarcus sp.]|nr:ABC transporter substrate-binding protein [Azoarcus sp.]